MLGYAGICCDMVADAGIGEDMLEYAGIGLDMVGVVMIYEYER